MAAGPLAEAAPVAHLKDVLTSEAKDRSSLESSDKVDRLVANRAIARIVARMLWEHERRAAAVRMRSSRRSH
jgi:hypothetical protein